MTVLQTALTFLAVLSLLVLAHELGHFVTAKRAGIKVQEFGFGYPPRLFGVRVGETLYSLNLLPLGGFVRMLGENSAPGDPRAFASKSKAARAIVLVAGSGMNLLLAPVLFSIALMVGEAVPCETCHRVQIVGLQADSPASNAGLQAEDVLVSIAGQPVASADDVRAAIRNAGEQDLAVVVERDGQDVSLHLVPRVNPQEGRLMIGVALGPEYVTVRRPIWQAVPMGFQRTWDTLRLFGGAIKQMAAREQPVEVAGPVGIARETGRMAQAGLTYLLQFTAFLSLNLAIFNLLPIPGLDGARLAFVALEGARRGQRVSPQVEGVIHFVGLMLLITLMLFVSYNDVRRILPT
jgi:regulator of sigma E protease